jgi:membrane-bound lytic murein transglycosylase B
MRRRCVTSFSDGEKMLDSEMTNSTSRRAALSALGALIALGVGGRLFAQPSNATFAQWVEGFRARARVRGVSDATYRRLMETIKPDTSVYALNRAQPEFHEEVWQYLNRRVSDWRIRTGQERAREHMALLERVEREYGVDRYVMLGLWGMESAFDGYPGLKVLARLRQALKH